MDKFFPIKTDTSCRLKWSWSSIFLNSGTTASCHRASESEIPDDFGAFHNTEVKQQDRAMMLQGRWPGRGCEYCERIEQSGGASDRMFQNQIPGVYPPELDLDADLVQVKPAVLEVLFSNTCNLGCVYCRPSLSSVIEQEWKRFNIASSDEVDPVFAEGQYQRHAPRFWQWFEQHGTSLQRLQILGGEPFLQRREMQTLIDHFSTQDFSHLEFNVITNLSVPSQVIDPVLEQLAALVEQKRLRRIDIQTSIDSWGDQQMYSRWRIDLDQFERNMQRLIDLGCFRIGLLSTVNSLSIHEMPRLAEKFLSWNARQRIHWYMHLVLPVGTSVFDPTVFDACVFDRSLEQVRRLLPEPDDWDRKNLRATFDGIDSTIRQQCRDDRAAQQRLFHYLDDNDRRRGSHWPDIFPWLHQIRQEHHVV